MNKIPKKLLDELIEVNREYWNSENTNHKALDKRIAIAKKIEKKTGLDWLAIANFLDAILMSDGLEPDAENDEIYCALHCLGWMEVADK